MPQKKQAKTVQKKVTVPRNLAQKIVSIKRTYQAADYNSNASVYSAANSYSVALSACPGYTDFTNLFDSYRIVKVRIDFMPNLTGNPANALPGLYNMFHMAVDHTDVSVPSQSGDVLQYDQHRSVQPYRPFSITWKPAPSSAYYNSATLSGYGPVPGAWIDSSSPAVPHYGLKTWWDCNSATSTRIIPFVTIWAEFKEAR